MISLAAPLKPLPVHQLAGTKWWLTLADYMVGLVIDEDLWTITVPAGYRFDRASIPTVAGVLVTKDSLGCVGPLVHDALYGCDGEPEPAMGEYEPTCDPWRRFTRLEADQVFRAVMLEDNIKPWRARLAYWAVRLFARRW